MKIFNLPDLGEGLPEAELRQWYVKEGDYVEIDQPIACMETAKALVDIPAPQSGYISKRYPKMNDIVSTDTPLVSFSDYPLDCCHPAEWRGLEKKHQTPQQVRGDSTGVRGDSTGVRGDSSTNNTIHAMPAVKALARKFNVDLSTVIPSAPNGSITMADVKAATQQALPGELLSGTRRAMAMNMNKAHAEKTVSGILCEDADIQAWDSKQDYTLRLIRAVIMACQAEPALNAHYFNNSLTRQLFTDVNIALAMDTPSGLYVPVLKNANKSQPNELREQIDQFKQDPHPSSAEPMSQASIVLSNVGSIGGRYAMPVIIPPIVAIIATGRARDQVMAIAGKPEVRKVIPLTLGFDHRAVTGGEAARFLMAMIEDLNFQA